MQLLETELAWNPKKHHADAIAYYGAGAGSAAKQKEMAAILKKHFGIKDIEVNGDMTVSYTHLDVYKRQDCNVLFTVIASTCNK